MRHIEAVFVEAGVPGSRWFIVLGHDILVSDKQSTCALMHQQQSVAPQLQFPTSKPLDFLDMS